MDGATPRLPKLVAFDLDGCLWDPEMYQLYGGSPFRPHGLDVKDCRGEHVRVLGDARDILRHLRDCGVLCAIASSCDEPQWARECLALMKLHEQETTTTLADVFHKDMWEIRKASSKQEHLKAISKKSGVALHDILFLDNERWNVEMVGKIGVTAILTPPTGVTWNVFNEAVKKHNQKLEKK